ncbi:MAG: hypothetical protein AB6733_09455 [Clostridiaceae bacterium]
MATEGLAGYNAIRYCLGIPLSILTRNTEIGDIIAYANYKMETKEGRKNRYTFAGAEYFKRMKENNMYSLYKEEIVNRIKRDNLYNIFNERLV